VQTKYLAKEIKKSKIIKAKDQLLVVESLVMSKPLVPCMSRSRLFMGTLMGKSRRALVAQVLPC
jgi:hypothetical protein